MRNCSGCGCEIPEARLKALPSTETCVGCSEEEKVQGLVVWDGKHTPILQVYPHGKLPHDRKGFHADIGANSVNNPRLVQSMANLDLSLKIKLEAPIAYQPVNLAPDRCHPERARAVPDGRCAECAVDYYKKRLGS